MLAVTLRAPAIGFIDDFSKILKRRSLGLVGPLEARAAGAGRGAAGLVAHHTGALDARSYVPLLDFHVELGLGWYVSSTWWSPARPTAST